MKNNYSFEKFDLSMINELFEIKAEICSNWVNTFGLLKSDKNKFTEFFNQVGFDHGNVVCLKHKDEIVGFSLLTITNSIGLKLKGFPVTANLISPIIKKEHIDMQEYLMNELLDKISNSPINTIEAFSGTLWESSDDLLVNNGFKLIQKILTVIDITNYHTTELKGFEELKKEDIGKLAELHIECMTEEMRKYFTLEEEIESINENIDNSEHIYYVQKENEKIIMEVHLIYSEDDGPTFIPSILENENYMNNSIYAFNFALSHVKTKKYNKVNLVGVFFVENVFSNIDNISVKDLNMYVKQIAP